MLKFQESHKILKENSENFFSFSFRSIPINADKSDDDYEFEENDYFNEQDESIDILDDLENKNFELLTEDEKAVVCFILLI